MKNCNVSRSTKASIKSVKNDSKEERTVLSKDSKNQNELKMKVQKEKRGTYVHNGTHSRKKKLVLSVYIKRQLAYAQWKTSDG
jgi:hypothetical protein